MKTISVLFVCMFMIGCTTLYDKGKFENNLLRAQVSDKHASMERVEGTGAVVKTIGDNVAPEIYLGKYAHTQIYLPLVKCITFYTPEGIKDREECTTIPDMTVEAQVSAVGGRIGDIIKSGNATKLGSSYELWIKTVREQIKNSSLDDATKEDYLKILDDAQK